MASIELWVGPGGLRRWHASLCDTLARARPDGRVATRVVPGAGEPPGTVAALLALERIVLRKSRPTLFDRVDDRRSGESGAAVDFVIDCSGGDGPASRDGPARIRPLFDGLPSEAAMIGALLAGGMPEITIEDTRTGAILAVGRSSSEAVDGLLGGIEAVASRTATMIEGIVARPGHREGARVAAPPGGRVATDAALARFAMAQLAHAAARAIYRLCFNAPHWRVGWRLHEGPGVMERGDLEGAPWHALADPGTHFYADPFPATRDGRTALFFESLDHRTGKGVIAAIPFGASGPEGPAVAVLEEPWHLSYPFMIEHDGDLWMIPESSEAGQVAIYRCVAFPGRWERAGTLMEGATISDATLFRHDGRFWMTSTTGDGYGGWSDRLAIHHAPDLLGPWEEHALKPVMIDSSAARPGGAVVRHDGALWRPIQDCRAGYGRALNLARIDVLTPTAFAQTVVHRVVPGPAWPGKRLHTLNRLGRLECIDGSALMPRLPALRPVFAPSTRARGSVTRVHGGAPR